MCTSPLPLLKFKHPSSPKWQTKVFPGYYLDEKREELELRLKNILSQGYEGDFCAVPCGQCYECRLQYSRQWANRCVMESLLYPEDRCYFITLTYSPEHSSHLLNKYGSLSLSTTDMTLFIKRLRRYYEYYHNLYGIRFYYAGEYGEHNFRPHYHLLAYNLPINDLEIIANNKFGDPLYHSDIIEELWGYGIVVIGQLNWNTCAYTARYVMKKLKGESKEHFEKLDLVNPYCRMSRRPGIAGEYFSLHWEDIYSHTSVENDLPLFNDKIILPSNGSKLNSVKPPRYFDNELEKIDPERLELIKSNRRRWQEIAEESRKNVMPLSDREYFEFKDSCLKKQNIGMYRKFQDLC